MITNPLPDSITTPQNRCKREEKEKKKEKAKLSRVEMQIPFGPNASGADHLLGTQSSANTLQIAFSRLFHYAIIIEEDTLN